MGVRHRASLQKKRYNRPHGPSRGSAPLPFASAAMVSLSAADAPPNGGLAGAFAYRTRVRFHQADPAGVLFFGRVFELVSDAYEELLEAAGLDFEQPDSLAGFTTPIVHVEADYRQAIRMGEMVTVRLRLERLGESSLTYAFELLGPDGSLRTSGRVVHVFVRLPGFEKIPMPDHARRAFLSLAERWGMALPCGPTPAG